MTADDRLTPLSLAVLLMGAGLCLWGSSALAAAAGQVQFVAGPVQLDRGGRSQAVVKGAQVEAGDVLRSGPTGQAQIRFTDGGIMALYPQSQISIGAYSDSAQAGSGRPLSSCSAGRRFRSNSTLCCRSSAQLRNAAETCAKSVRNWVRWMPSSAGRNAPPVSSPLYS